MSLPKKYFWLKLRDTFFTEPKIKKLRRIAGGDTYTIIYQKIMLLSIRDGGLINFQGIEKNLVEELSLIMDEDSSNVEVTLAYLYQAGLMEQLSEGSFLVVDVPALIGSESDSAERMRRLRQKQVSQCDTTVQLSDESVTTELETEKKIKINKKTLFRESDFLKFVAKIRQDYYSQDVKKPAFYCDEIGNEYAFYIEPSSGRQLIFNKKDASTISTDEADRILRHLHKNQHLIKPRVSA